VRILTQAARGFKCLAREFGRRRKKSACLSEKRCARLWLV